MLAYSPNAIPEYMYIACMICNYGGEVVSSLKIALRARERTVLVRLVYFRTLRSMYATDALP